MKVHTSVRARLCAVAVMMALAAGCGGGGGGGGGGGAPAPAPGPAPAPAPAEVRGWSKPFGSASVVIGQSGFDRRDAEGEGTATPVGTPVGRVGVTSDGRLLVGSENSILVFNNYEAMNGPVAVSVFSPDIGTFSRMRDLSIQGQKLIAAVSAAVLIYDSVPTSGLVAADRVAGNVSLPGCTSSRLEERTSAHLTPDGRRLIVADTANNRVLIWNDVDQATGSSLGDADIVLGQQGTDLCTANDADGDRNSDDRPTGRTLKEPTSVWSDGVRLLVADAGNNRVLIWNDIRQVVSFQVADHVIGQQDFVSFAANAGQAAPSDKGLSYPTSIDVSDAGELAVADRDNDRVLIWSAIPTSDGQPARFVVGKPDFVSADAVPLSAKSLSSPHGVRFHGRNLLVSDHLNQRVLVWRESD